MTTGSLALAEQRKGARKFNFICTSQPQKDRREAVATQTPNIELKEKEDKAVQAIESLRQRYLNCKSEVIARKS